MRLLKNKIALSVLLILLLIGIGIAIPSGRAETEKQPEKIEHKVAIGSVPHEDESRQLKYNRDVNTLKTAMWVNKVNEITFYKRVAEIKEQQRQAELARQAEAARQKQIKRSQPRVSSNTPGNGQCGGNLPPCCVMQRESGGNIHAQNPTSSASGKWQVVNGTWNGYGGYPTAASAPESVQDAFAAQLWGGGSGASHWGGGC